MKKPLSAMEARKIIKELYGKDAFAKRERGGQKVVVLQTPTGHYPTRHIVLGRGDTFEQAIRQARKGLEPEALVARIKVLEVEMADMVEFIEKLQRKIDEEERQEEERNRTCHSCGHYK